MELFALPKEAYEELLNDIKEVKKRVNDLTAPDERIIENQEFLKIMNVSYKTARTWRIEGKIGYTKEGNKIYYRTSDIRDFLDRFYHKPTVRVNDSDQAERALGKKF